MSTATTAPSIQSAPRVLIKTAEVSGRRTLHFTTLGEMLEDAECLCAAKHVTALGNWQLGPTLEHLARTIDMSLDGAKFRAPWYVRLLGPLFKKYMLTHPMRPGFKLPQNAAEYLIPTTECPVNESLAHLRSGVRRLINFTERQPSPAFGRLTCEEWDQLHLRHAELHLSFLVPG
jgi:hypothetical protein